MSDGYRLNALIDASKEIGKIISDASDKIVEIINSFGENEDDEQEVQLKEERQ